MLHWAQNPRPLPESSISRFVATVKSGLQCEGAHPRQLILQQGEKILTVLQKWNQWLAAEQRKICSVLVVGYGLQLMEVIDLLAPICPA
ncbi:MAG: hypothetical protein DRG80_02245 [Deltaproteobacteria bacterium]|nr:MAG: hypothetical protein DRG80_02245 [Deltaproteobacteria bacterium]